MRRLLPIILVSTSLLALPKLVFSAGYQQCTSSSTCTIGEFLYDDNYSPLTGASCTLTAKYPDNTSFINSASMTGGSDGWYSYDATIGTTEGLYHANICCTPASGTLCIDKSFEVKSASGSSLTPAAIWGYSDRTLTGYGSLVSDIWNYSGRTLTSFGSLVGDIWGYSNRTMTSFGSLVENIWGAEPSRTTASTPNPSSLQGIIVEQTKQRELLEKLVNAPIVTLELSDSDKPDLTSKLSESKKQASLLYDAVTSAKSRLLAIDTKWSKLSPDSLEQELTNISQSWSSPAGLDALTSSWNTPVIEKLNQASSETKSSLTSLLASLGTAKPSTPPSQLFTAIESLSNLEKDLGDITSVSGDFTLFGYLSSVSERNNLLDNENKKLAQILEDWDSQGENGLTKRINDSKAKILAINEFPGGESVVSPSNPKATGKNYLKNLLFSLQGLIGLNQNQLASAANSPVRGLWLEEGSIIFRAVITNPSKIVSQTAPLKFYLPKELKNEDIITIDPDLTANYDVTAESLSVTGNFNLSPGATKIVAVEVNDIWQLNEDQLTALKSKANDLIKPLGKSNLLSQGVVLKNSIESDVDKLIRSQNKNVKPENRIRTHREAMLALATTNSSMTQLENLVAQSSSNGSLMGFVGGIGTTAVFGIVLVIVAGFVFLSTYFKKLTNPTHSKKTMEKDDDSLNLKPTIEHLSRLELPTMNTSSNSWQMPAIIAVVIVITAGGTISLTQMAKPKESIQVNQVDVTPSQKPTPTPSPVEEIQISPSPTPKSTGKEESKSLQTNYSLVVPEDSSVNIRNKPSSSADIIMAIKETQDIYVFKEDGDWRQIGFKESDSIKGYWVNIKFIESK